MTFLDDFDGTDENSTDRIKPEIRALIRRGNVTPTEVAELRCNSWEWEALVPALNDEAFIERMEHALENCFTRRERPFTTYNQAVEGLYAPELLKRFESAARAARDYAETIDNVRGALGQEATHYLVIADDVKDLVDAIEKDTVEHAEYVRRRRLGEIVVPIDECESTRVLRRLRENWMYRYDDLPKKDNK